MTLGIKKSVVHRQLYQIKQLIDCSEPLHDGLLSGNLGKAFYHFYYYKCYGDTEQRDRAQAVIDEVTSKITDGSSKLLRSISLSSGLTALAWSINTFKEEELIDSSFFGNTTSLDQKICEIAISQIQDSNLDFLHSSVGALAYLSDQVEKDESLIKPLTYCISCLKEVMYVDDHQGYFKSCYLYRRQNHVHVDDVDFSISHGSCAILLALIRLYEKGIAVDDIRLIIEMNVKFILETMKSENIEDIRCSVFPSNVIVSTPKKYKYTSDVQRLGWCYGDLNQVLLLHKSGKLLKRADWISIAESVGNFTLQKRDQESTQIEDVYLCHGSAGVATFYKALYYASGNSQYLVGYDYWIEQTSSCLSDILSRNSVDRNAYSMLEGLAGTGLTLMDNIFETGNGWKKFLLLDE